MKTYLKGIQNLRVPKFSYYVAKLSDNAYVKTKNDIEMAFAFYNRDRAIQDKLDSSINSSLTILKDKLMSPKIRSKVKKIFANNY